MHQEASIAVTIHLSGNVEDLVKFLEDKGSSARNVGEDYIEAYVPVSLPRADLGTARRYPGAGNHPGGAGSELASDRQPNFLMSLTLPHGVGQDLEGRGAEVTRKIRVLTWNRSPKPR